MRASCGSKGTPRSPIQSLALSSFSFIGRGIPIRAPSEALAPTAATAPVTWRHGRLHAEARRHAERIGCCGSSPGLLPRGHLLARPRARLAREREVEVEQGARLARP